MSIRPSIGRWVLAPLLLAGGLSATVACSGGGDVGADPPGQPDGDGGGDFVSGELVRVVDVEGLRRECLQYVPPSATAAMAEGGVPLVVVLHGAGDTAKAFLDVTGLRALADGHALVVVVPDAPAGFAGEGSPAEVRADVGFVLACVAATADDYALDPGRYYLTGFSRGAGFAGLIATASRHPGAASFGVPDFESPFAAYALSAGYDMFMGQVDLTGSSPKRPMWLVHAGGDGVVPFMYGERFARALESAGWPDVPFTRVEAGTPPHNWLWQSGYGHDAEELWQWLSRYTR